MTTTDLVGAKKTLDSGMRRVILFNTPMGVPWPGTCLDGWTKMDMDEAYEAEVTSTIPSWWMNALIRPLK